jgi:Trk K+ transport system NAD-binding subunit
VAAFLADENFEDAVAHALAALGHDVLTVRDAGLLQTPDPAVLAAAAAAGRIVLTHDHDYHVLHKSGVPHAGIVYASVDYDFAALATRIHAALAATPITAGLLIRVVKPNPPPQVP